MKTATTTRPSWYTDEDDTAWGKIKAAFRRDWTQTKHDFGGNDPDLNQQVGDTVAQAAGTRPIPPANVKTPRPQDNQFDTYTDEDEPAYRYGYAASRHFDGSWDDTLEAKLRNDFDEESAWERRREAIRRGWAYGKGHNCDSCP